MDGHPGEPDLPLRQQPSDAQRLALALEVLAPPLDRRVADPIAVTPTQLRERAHELRLLGSGPPTPRAAEVVLDSITLALGAINAIEGTSLQDRLSRLTSRARGLFLKAIYKLVGRQHFSPGDHVIVLRRDLLRLRERTTDQLRHAPAHATVALDARQTAAPAPQR